MILRYLLGPFHSSPSWLKWLLKRFTKKDNTLCLVLFVLLHTEKKKPLRKYTNMKWSRLVPGVPDARLSIAVPRRDGRREISHAVRAACDCRYVRCFTIKTSPRWASSSSSSLCPSSSPSCCSSRPASRPMTSSSRNSLFTSCPSRVRSAGTTSWTRPRWSESYPRVAIEASRWSRNEFSSKECR